CIDAGEQFVLQTLATTYDVNQAAITTSIANALDTGFADMGYHYPFYKGPKIQYKLTINVARPTLTPEDIKNLETTQAIAVDGKPIQHVQPGPH
ncbi:MAG: hypothetical protein NT024_08920, partial [Proteobacteria bacterium]|nr:hypothetical protein [Pseudomonadota bacterium]